MGKLSGEKRRKKEHHAKEDGNEMQCYDRSWVDNIIETTLMNFF
jgi:hypothetical protein